MAKYSDYGITRAYTMLTQQMIKYLFAVLKYRAEMAHSRAEQNYFKECFDKLQKHIKEYDAAMLTGGVDVKELARQAGENGIEVVASKDGHPIILFEKDKKEEILNILSAMELRANQEYSKTLYIATEYGFVGADKGDFIPLRDAYGNSLGPDGEFIRGRFCPEGQETECHEALLKQAKENLTSGQHWHSVKPDGEFSTNERAFIQNSPCYLVDENNRLYTVQNEDGWYFDNTAGTIVRTPEAAAWLEAHGEFGEPEFYERTFNGNMRDSNGNVYIQYNEYGDYIDETGEVHINTAYPGHYEAREEALIGNRAQLQASQALEGRERFSVNEDGNYVSQKDGTVVFSRTRSGCALDNGTIIVPEAGQEILARTQAVHVENGRLVSQDGLISMPVYNAYGDYVDKNGQIVFNPEFTGDRLTRERLLHEAVDTLGDDNYTLTDNGNLRSEFSIDGTTISRFRKDGSTIDEKTGLLRMSSQHRAEQEYIRVPGGWQSVDGKENVYNYNTYGDYYDNATNTVVLNPDITGDESARVAMLQVTEARQFDSSARYRMTPAGNMENLSTGQINVRYDSLGERHAEDGSILTNTQDMDLNEVDAIIQNLQVVSEIADEEESSRYDEHSTETDEEQEEEEEKGEEEEEEEEQEEKPEEEQEQEEAPEEEPEKEKKKRKKTKSQEQEQTPEEQSSSTTEPQPETPYEETPAAMDTPQEQPAAEQGTTYEDTYTTPAEPEASPSPVSSYDDMVSSVESSVEPEATAYTYENAGYDASDYLAQDANGNALSDSGTVLTNEQVQEVAASDMAMAAAFENASEAMAVEEAAAAAVSAAAAATIAAEEVAAQASEAYTEAEQAYAQAKEQYEQTLAQYQSEYSTADDAYAYAQEKSKMQMEEARLDLETRQAEEVRAEQALEAARNEYESATATQISQDEASRITDSYHAAEQNLHTAETEYESASTTYQEAVSTYENARAAETQAVTLEERQAAHEAAESARIYAEQAKETMDASAETKASIQAAYEESRQSYETMRQDMVRTEEARTSYEEAQSAYHAAQEKSAQATSAYEEASRVNESYVSQAQVADQGRTEAYKSVLESEQAMTQTSAHMETMKADAAYAASQLEGYRASEQAAKDTFAAAQVKTEEAQIAWQAQSESSRQVYDSLNIGGQRADLFNQVPTAAEALVSGNTVEKNLDSLRTQVETQGPYTPDKESAQASYSPTFTSSGHKEADTSRPAPYESKAPTSTTHETHYSTVPDTSSYTAPDKAPTFGGSSKAKTPDTNHPAETPTPAKAGERAGHTATVQADQPKVHNTQTANRQAVSDNGKNLLNAARSAMYGQDANRGTDSANFGKARQGAVANAQAQGAGLPQFQSAHKAGLDKIIDKMPTNSAARYGLEQMKTFRPSILPSGQGLVNAAFGVIATTAGTSARNDSPTAKQMMSVHRTLSPLLARSTATSTEAIYSDLLKQSFSGGSFLSGDGSSLINKLQGQNRLDNMQEAYTNRVLNGRKGLNTAEQHVGHTNSKLSSDVRAKKLPKVRGDKALSINDSSMTALRNFTGLKLDKESLATVKGINAFSDRMVMQLQQKGLVTQGATGLVFTKKFNNMSMEELSGLFGVTSKDDIAAMLNISKLSLKHQNAANILKRSGSMNKITGQLLRQMSYKDASTNYALQAYQMGEMGAKTFAQLRKLHQNSITNKRTLWHERMTNRINRSQKLANGEIVSFRERMERSRLTKRAAAGDKNAVTQLNNLSNKYRDLYSNKAETLRRIQSRGRLRDIPGQKIKALRDKAGLKLRDARESAYSKLKTRYNSSKFGQSRLGGNAKTAAKKLINTPQSVKNMANALRSKIGNSRLGKFFGKINRVNTKLTEGAKKLVGKILRPLQVIKDAIMAFLKWLLGKYLILVALVGLVGLLASLPAMLMSSFEKSDDEPYTEVLQDRFDKNDTISGLVFNEIRYKELEWADNTRNFGTSLSPVDLYKLEFTEKKIDAKSYALSEAGRNDDFIGQWAVDPSKTEDGKVVEGILGDTPFFGAEPEDHKLMREIDGGNLLEIRGKPQEGYTSNAKAVTAMATVFYQNQSDELTETALNANEGWLERGAAWFKKVWRDCCTALSKIPIVGGMFEQWTWTQVVRDYAYPLANESHREDFYLSQYIFPTQYTAPDEAHPGNNPQNIGRLDRRYDGAKDTALTAGKAGKRGGDSGDGTSDGESYGNQEYKVDQILLIPSKVGKIGTKKEGGTGKVMFDNAVTDESSEWIALEYCPGLPKYDKVEGTGTRFLFWTIEEPDEQIVGHDDQYNGYGCQRRYKFYHQWLGHAATTESDDESIIHADEISKLFYGGEADPWGGEEGVDVSEDVSPWDDDEETLIKQGTDGDIAKAHIDSCLRHIKHVTNRGALCWLEGEDEEVGSVYDNGELLNAEDDNGGSDWGDGSDPTIDEYFESQVLRKAIDSACSGFRGGTSKHIKYVREIEDGYEMLIYEWDKPTKIRYEYEYADTDGDGTTETITHAKEETDYPNWHARIIHLQHNCRGLHVGYYCGGHLQLRTRGVVYGFSAEQEAGDVAPEGKLAAYTPKMLDYEEDSTEVEEEEKKKWGSDIPIWRDVIDEHVTDDKEYIGTIKVEKNSEAIGDDGMVREDSVLYKLQKAEDIFDIDLLILRTRDTYETLTVSKGPVAVMKKAVGGVWKSITNVITNVFNWFSGNSKSASDELAGQDTVDEGTPLSNWKSWTYENMGNAISLYQLDWAEEYNVPDTQVIVGGIYNLTYSVGGRSNALDSMIKTNILTELGMQGLPINADLDASPVLDVDGEPMSKEKIELIDRLRHVRYALNTVGKVSYAQTRHGFLYEDVSGHLTDCSGYVSNIWRDVLGKSLTTQGLESIAREYNCYHDYSLDAVRAGDVKPGDIVLSNPTGGDAHALLFIGYLDPEVVYGAYAASADEMNKQFDESEEAKGLGTMTYDPDNVYINRAEEREKEGAFDSNAQYNEIKGKKQVFTVDCSSMMIYSYDLPEGSVASSELYTLQGWKHAITNWFTGLNSGDYGSNRAKTGEGTGSAQNDDGQVKVGAARARSGNTRFCNRSYMNSENPSQHLYYIDMEALRDAMTADGKIDPTKRLTGENYKNKGFAPDSDQAYWKTAERIITNTTRAYEELEVIFPDDTYKTRDPIAESAPIDRDAADIPGLIGGTQGYVTEDAVLLSLPAYISQKADAYRNVYRPGGGTIARYSCCDCSYMMAASILTGHTYNVVDTVQKYVSNMAFYQGRFLADNGLHEVDVANSKKAIQAQLSQGHPVVLQISNITPAFHNWKSNSHFITIIGYNEKGYYIADPNNQAKSYGGSDGYVFSYDEAAQYSYGFSQIKAVMP